MHTSTHAATSTNHLNRINTLSPLSLHAGEEVRWAAQSREFESSINRLPGDCAVASAFVSYLGAFNKSFRELLLRRDFLGVCTALAVPSTPDLQVTRMLADDVEVGEWALQGLPNDELSVQNGIAVTRATRTPLLIDPQGQVRDCPFGYDLRETGQCYQDALFGGELCGGWKTQHHVLCDICWANAVCFYRCGIC